jgi:hypothetical protein
MNLLLQSKPSPWSDIWTDTITPKQRKYLKHVDLHSITVGNGWINGRIQYRALVDFACGGAKDRGIPQLAADGVCRWAEKLLIQGEKLMDRCYDRFSWYAHP